jgi:hypothetical protein
VLQRNPCDGYEEVVRVRKQITELLMDRAEEPANQWSTIGRVNKHSCQCLELYVRM